MKRQFLSGIYGFALVAFAAECGQARADWPMHRGSPRLNGFASMSAVDAPKEVWTFTAGKPVKGGAAIAGGRVFVGDDSGVIHALELQTGREIWSFKTEGAVEATPLILKGNVFVGSSDGTLYSISAGAGALRWKYATGDKILGGANTAPAGDGGADWVFVGSYDSQLHCVDAESGKAVWTLPTDNYINGTPALLPEGALIFGGCDALLRIVSLKDGRQLRQIEAEAYVASSVAVAEDGTAYVGHYGNTVLGLNTKEATVLWRYRDRNFPYVSSAALTPDRVLIGGADKRLHCLERQTGKPVWQFASRGKIDASPVVCGDTVVVGSLDGRLYGVELAGGMERWAHDFGSPVTASAAVSDGWIVLGTEDGVVHALQCSKSKP